MKWIFSIIMCLSLFTASADSWDNLTEKEAAKTAKYLKKNAYILDYCDCCGGSDVYLLKVVSTEIVQCSWNKEHKSIKVKVEKIAKLETTDVGPSKYRAEPINNSEEYTISMNYTFGYDKKMRWAVPLFKLVDYNMYDDHVCKGATNYPEPTLQNGTVINADYKAWYDKRIAKK